MIDDAQDVARAIRETSASLERGSPITQPPQSSTPPRDDVCRRPTAPAGGGTAAPPPPTRRKAQRHPAMTSAGARLDGHVPVWASRMPHAAVRNGTYALPLPRCPVATALLYGPWAISTGAVDGA